MGLPKNTLYVAWEIVGRFVEPLFTLTLIIQVSRTKLDS
jgi:hypothetical protein